MSGFTKEDNELIQREFEQLRLAALKRCASQEEYEGVIKAFDFANEAHKGVRRRSGEPYILHPIAVAKIVVQEIGLGYKSIVTALLHDVVEDTEYTTDDVERLFGSKIASLVDGLTKIKSAMDSKIEGGISEKSIQAENFKRILLTLNDDVRVILIKLADRLHNLRTIESMPERKKDKILSETMYIFIPLAHRLGLYSIKSEMENIWLRFKEPDAYREISERISRNVAERDTEINEFIAPIETALKQADISAFFIGKIRKGRVFYCMIPIIMIFHLIIDDRILIKSHAGGRRNYHIALILDKIGHLQSNCIFGMCRIFNHCIYIRLIAGADYYIQLLRPLNPVCDSGRL